MSGDNRSGPRALRGPFSWPLVAAGVATVVPAVLPAVLQVGSAPLPSLHTEALALLGWGLFLSWTCRHLPRVPGAAAGAVHGPATWAALAVLVLLGLAIAVSVVWRGLPVVIGVRHAGVLMAAAVALWVGALLGQAEGKPAFIGAVQGLLWALCVAGLLNALVALLQRGQVSGPWPPLAADGRATGALGQPNLLGTQLLWAYAALAALVDLRRLRPGLGWVLAGLLLLALALSASRSAALSCLLLAVWGMADRQLGRHTRALLVAAPLLLALAWWVLAQQQAAGGAGFAGVELLGKADPSSSRAQLWRQCLVLVQAHPGWGVGWGQFNFAWTITPMPGLPRTAAYTFTHAHNLPIHWAVELGLPLTLLLVGLLLFAGWRAGRLLWAGSGQAPAPVAQRAAWVMVAVIAVHSQFEYPLWYLHFLLPGAFLLGLSSARPPVPSLGTDTSARSMVAPLLLALGAVGLLYDYRPVAQVYSPGPDAAAADVLVQRGKRSWLFHHFVDRLSSTTVPVAQRRLADYQVVVFEVLDLKLLGSWAQTLAQQGELDKARHLTDRLREFDGPAAAGLFARCAQTPAFQCQPAQARHDFSEFRRLP